MAITIVLALMIFDYISLFIEIVSSATCAPLAFTLPALFHYKLKGGPRKTAHLILVILTVCLCIFMVFKAVTEFACHLGGLTDDKHNDCPI